MRELLNGDLESVITSFQWMSSGCSG